MRNEIDKAFEITRKENRPALISFTVAGDNTKKKSLEILKSISETVDIAEWGMAFNCPGADGPEIQNSSYRAIKNGINLKDTFSLIKKYKKYKNSKPLILMGYYQLIYNYGEKKFIKQCKDAGVSGLIVVDLPWPDNKNFSKLCKKNSICFVQLIAPTTSSIRIKSIVRDSHQLIYQVSNVNVTGGKLKSTAKTILKNYEIIKKINPSKNVMIGFGITKDTIANFKTANGLVVGSACCRVISNALKNRLNPAKKLNNMLDNLKKKIV